MLDDIVEFNLDGKQIRGREILVGKIACRGNLKEGEYLTGYVRKITKNSNKVENNEEFNEGEILVTQMTDPSMMEEIRKSKAIVTEIGGLLSHAAIVSRELNLLCIIATEDAMKKTYDGQRIYLHYRKMGRIFIKPISR